MLTYWDIFSSVEKYYPVRGPQRKERPMRGEAKKSICYELLPDMLTERLKSYLESVRVIPTELHGFLRECSTERACRILAHWPRHANRYTRCSSTSKRLSTRRPRTRLCSGWPKVNVLVDLLAVILQKNRTTID